MWTQKQYQACNAALLINDGACNGLGIAKALDLAYAAFKDKGTDESNKCAPAILILTQLCHLAGGVFDSDAYFKACDTCQEIVNEGIKENERKLKESVMADADSESLENLQAAADMLDKL